MAVLKIKRGDVLWINFDPSLGTEIKKKRPAVVVSNDSANKFADHIQVIPFTSNIGKVYPCECLVVLKGQQSKAMADQIKTVSKERCVSRITKLSKDDLGLIENVIKIQLEIE